MGAKVTPLHPPTVIRQLFIGGAILVIVASRPTIFWHLVATVKQSSKTSNHSFVAVLANRRGCSGYGRPAATQHVPDDAIK